MSTKKAVEKLKDIKNLEVAKDTPESDSGIGSKTEPMKSKQTTNEESGRLAENMEVDNKNDDQAEDRQKEKKGDDESDSCPEDEYVVEKIIKKRTVDGRTEYFIKWKDWPASTNTWEPVEHLHCPEKVEEFEAKLLATKTAQAAARKKAKEFSLPQSEIGYGFDRQLEPEKIIAATDHGGALKFVIKWKNRERPDIVLAAEANMKCPQIVIKFYEDRLTWTNSSILTGKEEAAKAEQEEQLRKQQQQQPGPSTIK